MLTLQIKQEHSIEILSEMCRRVGIDYQIFDFKQLGWFRTHSWTEKEQEDFRVWLGKYLEKKKYCHGKKRGQNMGYYEAGKLILSYGWITKEAKCEKKNNQPEV